MVALHQFVTYRVTFSEASFLKFTHKFYYASSPNALWSRETVEYHS
jgi:predicted GNAT superfamily acetyltransferase